MPEAKGRIRSGRRSAFTRLGVVAVVAIALAGIASLFAAQRLLCQQGRAEGRHRALSIAAAAAGAFKDEVDGRSTDVARKVLQSVIDADPDIKLIAILDRHHAPILTYGDSDATAERGAESVIPILGTGPSSQTSVSPAGFARVVVSYGDSRHYLVWHAIWTGIATSLAAAAAWFAVVRLQRRASVSLSVARQLAGHLRARRDDDSTTDEFSELDSLLQHLVEDHEAAEARRAKRAELHSQDLHAAITDAAKGERDKQRLLAFAEEMVECERERIALEIHDNLNGTVVSIKLYAEAIAATAGGESGEEVRHCANEITSLAAAFYDNARTIVRELRPEALDTLDLQCAVAEMVRALNESHRGCTFDFEGASGLPEPSRQLAIALYRAVQEALANVVKHAGATAATVRIQSAPPPHHLRVVVDDNGVGMHPRQEARDGSGGLGLIGMRERIQRAGGTLSIATAENGTRITLLA